MAHIGMAHIGMAHIGLPYIAMAYIEAACGGVGRACARTALAGVHAYVRWANPIWLDARMEACIHACTDSTWFGWPPAAPMSPSAVNATICDMGVRVLVWKPSMRTCARPCVDAFGRPAGLNSPSLHAPPAYHHIAAAAAAAATTSSPSSPHSSCCCWWSIQPPSHPPTHPQQQRRRRQPQPQPTTNDQRPTTNDQQPTTNNHNHNHNHDVRVRSPTYTIHSGTRAWNGMSG